MNINLRPDLKTSGGEVHDIVLNHQYVGTISLIYREGERVAGSVQLEQDSLSRAEKPVVLEFITQYVQGLAGALAAPKCDVFVTYSPFETIVSTSEEIEDQTTVHEWYPEELEREIEFEEADDDVDDEPDLERIEAFDDEEIVRLEVISAGRHVTVYEVYDLEDDLLAVSVVKQYGADAIGEVRWDRLPSEEEMDQVTALIVRDLDEQLMDTIHLEMKLGDMQLQTMALTHEDLLEDDEDYEEEEEPELFVNASFTEHTFGGYSIEPVRDDHLVLTYAIYHHERYGAVPVGIATVDIGEDGLSGFIELEIPGTTEDRANMCTLLMRELDKSLDYEALHLTLMFRNEVIDEIQFENEVD
ncbi:hypothetical protein [Paenibacillus guangzhouensis]|uniref:hypothetical protein n=1 Tax=Paenibacillus guangzhouensis TaxID=1473112 RepID=UPI0012673DFA|nr:hypothetical protein [Paenibacillus guangzhouensis]